MFYDEEHYFSLRKAAKTYISKVFKYDGVEPVRNVTMVMEGNDQVLFGEIEGAISLRLTGEKRKTQVTAMVTQDHKKQRKLTLRDIQVVVQVCNRHPFHDDRQRRVHISRR